MRLSYFGGFFISGEDSYGLDFIELGNEIKFLSNSKSRLKILNYLFKKNRSLKELQEKTNLNYSSISGILSQLEKKEYIKKIGSKYILTSLGKMKMYYLFSSNQTLNFIDELNDFFTTHNVKPLLSSFKDLNTVHRFEMVQSSISDIYRAVNIFETYSKGSSSVNVILPFLYSGINSIFDNWLEKEVGVNLILNKDVYNALFDKIDKWQIKDKLRNKFFNISILNKPLDISLVVSDKGVALGLFKIDGTFDFNYTLVSSDRSAKIWANLLFEEYKDRCSEHIFLKEMIYDKGS